MWIAYAKGVDQLIASAELVVETPMKTEATVVLTGLLIVERALILHLRELQTRHLREKPKHEALTHIPLHAQLATFQSLGLACETQVLLDDPNSWLCELIAHCDQSSRMTPPASIKGSFFQSDLELPESEQASDSLIVSSAGTRPLSVAEFKALLNQFVALVQRQRLGSEEY